MNRTEELVYWIMERERMRFRKEAHDRAGGVFTGYAYGYSDDPHMGTVRYCNVRREDDKVTRWLATNWRPQHHAVWEIVLARMVNYIPTLEELIHPFGGSSGHAAIMMGFNVIGATMKTVRGRGEKLWTSVYTISTAGQSMDKVDYVMGVVGTVQLMETTKWHHTMFSTLNNCHRALMEVNGLGSFLAAQVVADLKNTQGHILQHAPDWHTWAAHGPGSLRGLSAYFNKPVTPKTFDKALAACWNETRPMLPAALQDLHMQDFQNCMCEFSKYMRVKRGGHVRNKYAA